MALDNIGASIGTIIGATVIALAPTISKWWTKKSKTVFGRFNKNIATRAKIKEIIIEILHHFQAQRISIYNYHNGDYSRSGFPFDYVSIVYEEVDANTAPIIQNFQKLPISMFTDLLESIIKNEKEGYVMQSSIATLQGDVQQQLIAYGCDTVYHFPHTHKIEDGGVSIIFARPKTLQKEEIEWTKFKVKELYRLQNSLHK